MNFVEELKAALVRLRKSPHSCQPYLYGTRHLLLKHFRYSVVFRERLHDIQIIAIAHTSCRPGYWARRIEQ